MGAGGQCGSHTRRPFATDAIFKQPGRAPGSLEFPIGPGGVIRLRDGIRCRGPAVAARDCILDRPTVAGPTGTAPASTDTEVVHAANMIERDVLLVLTDTHNAAYVLRQSNRSPIGAEMDRRLFALRHAKSSWSNSGLADHERPLSGRGHDALPRLRRALEERAPNIGVVLCSSAVRTVATLDGVRAALPDHVQVTIDDQLYGAGGQTWFERCREVGDDVEGVLLIGHNPGLERLVHDLAPTGEPTARVVLARGFPTGALAELAIPGPWSALDYDSCYLAAMQIPRELP
jgi:phosphohistidine phosphatase